MALVTAVLVNGHAISSSFGNSRRDYRTPRWHSRTSCANQRRTRTGTPFAAVIAGCDAPNRALASGTRVGCSESPGSPDGRTDAKRRDRPPRAPARSRVVAAVALAAAVANRRSGARARRSRSTRRLGRVRPQQPAVRLGAPPRPPAATRDLRSRSTTARARRRRQCSMRSGDAGRTRDLLRAGAPGRGAPRPRAAHRRPTGMSSQTTGTTTASWSFATRPTCGPAAANRSGRSRMPAGPDALTPPVPRAAWLQGTGHRARGRSGRLPTGRLERRRVRLGPAGRRRHRRPRRRATSRRDRSCSSMTPTDGDPTARATRPPTPSARSAPPLGLVGSSL